jgi:hypothetical protein
MKVAHTISFVPFSFFAFWSFTSEEWSVVIVDSLLIILVAEVRRFIMGDPLYKLSIVASEVSDKRTDCQCLPLPCHMDALVLDRLRSLPRLNNELFHNKYAEPRE